MIHQDRSNQDSTSENGTVASHHTQEQTISTALLATAIIKVADQTGQLHHIRALLDGGSSVSFITDSCVRKLGLKTRSSNTLVTRLQSSNVGYSTGVTSFAFFPHFQFQESFTVKALTMPKITSKQPTEVNDSSTWSHIQNLRLADPQLDRPASIDILLGSDIFWTLLQPQKICGPPNTPVAINSSLGWLVAGQQSPHKNTVTTFITEIALDTKLEKFWEAEGIPDTVLLSNEERTCEAHFDATHSRGLDGRFHVSIPWKDKVEMLGSSRHHAVIRLMQLERRMAVHSGSRNTEAVMQKKYIREEYNKFMEEYERMGHMTLVSPQEISQPSSLTFYIPHHFVQKKDSTTTKFRVVFDASAQTSLGLSLNDVMMVGPTIQDTLYDIIIRLRTHVIAFTADIEKMYRQIMVSSKDTNLQRILWRSDPSLHIQEYQLNTVTYGTASAPYNATKCLPQLSIDGATQFPLAKTPVNRDFYVDDLMSGAKGQTIAIETTKQINDLCDTAQFPLRKWTCNDEYVLSSIPVELRETKSLIPLDDDAAVKTLGIFWNPKLDEYHFKIDLPEPAERKYTKRLILSEMSQIFDPLGWLSPVIISAKILLQELWKYQHDWDSILPEQIQQQWTTFRSALPYLEGIKIPRCIITANSINPTLCGYADASELAYAAVVYTCCEQLDSPVQFRLVTSKTRVAPVKFTSLPRLELNAALLLSRVLKTVIAAMSVEIKSIKCYTDSSITLAWITSSPHRWKTYVRNRVQETQDNLPCATWYHISGINNPADCASRGISAVELLNHPMWWSGPSNWTSTEASTYTLNDDNLKLLKIEEKTEYNKDKIQSLLVCSETDGKDVLRIYSSWTKTQRTVAWITRFIANIKAKKGKTQPQAGPLTCRELNLHD